MASAVSLNAAATIANGQGLSVNTDMPIVINAFKSLGTVSTVANIFSTAANVVSNARPTIISSLENLGSGVTQARWLIDFWPANITPVCSNTVSLLLEGLPENIRRQGFGDLANYFNLTVVSTYGHTLSTASFIDAIETQADLPFSHGLAGFASVFQKSYGYAIQTFDNVSSVSMLQDKTYADSGIGHSGIHDLITGGLGTSTALLANVTSSWGTMYDVTNLNLFADPYIFGQNLLNQGLGTYGNLSINLTAAGLDVSDITKIPATVTTNSQVSNPIVTHTVIGAVELPALSTVSTTNTITGTSVDVIMSIYRKVTGNDLHSIVSATGIVVDDSTKLTTLADYLDFDKVINASQRNSLSQLNIQSLNQLGEYLHGKIGQSTFASWKEISTFLQSIEVPVLNYTTTTASSSVLTANAISAVANTAVGTGPLGNPIMSDFLGATAGINYVDNFGTLLSSYSDVSPTVYSALKTLDTAVVTWKNAYVASPEYIPPTTPVDTAVTAVNTALNSLPTTSKLVESQTAHITMANQLSREVSNLGKGGVVFDTGTTDQLTNFSQRFADSASDKDKYQTYQLITALITHDAEGDTLRASIAETINYNKLLSAGISIYNNPEPASAINSAATQNIPLSTYLSQNK